MTLPISFFYVDDKLEAMGGHTYLWKSDRTLIHEFTPKTPFYREQLMNLFRQKIGSRSYYRSTLDAAAYLTKQHQPQSKERQPPLKTSSTVPAKLLTTPRKRNRAISPSSSEEHRRPPMTKTDQGNKGLSLETPQKAETTSQTAEPPYTGEDETNQTKTTKIEPKLQPRKIFSGPAENEATQEKQQSQIVTMPTGKEALSEELLPFRPRRHPATYQPHSLQQEPTSCLLFRPHAGFSLHGNRATEADSRSPNPGRRSREGGSEPGNNPQLH